MNSVGANEFLNHLSKLTLEMDNKRYFRVKFYSVLLTAGFAVLCKQLTIAKCAYHKTRKDKVHN